MQVPTRSYLSLTLWIALLIGIGWLMGSLTKAAIPTWYSALNRSSLTPPNYIFPIAWTFLYALLGVCGWRLWSHAPYPKAKALKTLYTAQLVLNWSWTPLFFSYHCTGLALVVLILMDSLVGALLYLSYPKMKLLSLLLLPYFAWLLFASYLNLYICLYN